MVPTSPTTTPNPIFTFDGTQYQADYLSVLFGRLRVVDDQLAVLNSQKISIVNDLKQEFAKQLANQ